MEKESGYTYLSFQHQVPVLNAILKDPLLQLRPMRESDIDEIMAVELQAYEYPWSRASLIDCLQGGVLLLGLCSG